MVAQINNWRRLHFAITHRSLYVLGAGASFPIIPSNIIDETHKLIWENGVFTGSPQLITPFTPLRDRLFRYDEKYDINAFRTGGVSQNELNLHTPDAAIEIFLARTITVPGIRMPSQYAVFNRFYSSILFNFNNDNLANEVQLRHLCLRPHGTVDVNLVHSPAVSETLQCLAIPANFPRNLAYHRPLPEPSDIISGSAYQMLISRFQFVHAVVIIGYSFGEQHTTGLIDDSESFELIIDLLRWRPKPILLIGPDPERLCFRIEEAIRRKTVPSLRCKWNILAEFILSGAYARSLLNGRQEMSLLYRKFEDVVGSEQAVKLA